MKKYFFYFVLMLFAAACSKDSDENIGNPGGGETNGTFETITNSLHAFLASHAGATIEDLQAQLKNYSGQVTSEVLDDVLYVHMGDELYLCDPYGRTRFEISDEEIEEVDYESIINEINAALYPETEEETEDAPYATPKSERAPEASMAEPFTRAAGNNIVLSKQRVLYWDPFNLNTRLKGLQVGNKDITEAKRSLSDMKSFSDYDVVVMFCHGSPEGLVGLPMSYKNNLKKGEYFEGTIGTEINNEKCIFLTRQKLGSLLPDDLSHTMVFMCMCHSDSKSSVIRSVLNSKNVLTFAGANTIMDNAVVDFINAEFLPQFYSRQGSADEIIQRVFKSNSDSSPIFKPYTTISGHSGIYSFYYDNKIYYEPLVTAMSQVNNQPRASVVLPYELAVRTMNAAKTRAASGSSVSAGFWLKNKSTGEETEIEIVNTSVILYNRHDYKQLVSRLELLGNTCNIQSGTYNYRTYLEIDGEKKYSEDTFEFTKTGGLCPDDNHPHAIDLGLPSGTKWACCNVGASKPEEYGGYYAWGEKNGNKSEYKWKNYEHIENYDPGWFDFDIVNIGSNISGTTYDTALANWGAPWRMPTENDVKTLFESCYVKEIDLNGIHGAKITGPNGNCIFIPSAGYWNDEQLLDEDFLFYLWTGTLSPYNEHFAYSWGINGTTEVYSRECGMSVRAVCQ